MHRRSLLLYSTTILYDILVNIIQPSTKNIYNTENKSDVKMGACKSKVINKKQQNYTL